MKYDKETGEYTTDIPLGTDGFRKFVAKKFGFARTEVVRDRKRCLAKGSEHCECRAVDFFTTDVPKGREVFDWCVANAERYGIQSVIFNRRVWGFGKWSERDYRGPSPHTDHVHVGLNFKGAASFSEEEAMTPEEKKKFDELWERVNQVIDEKKALEKRVAQLEKKVR